MELRKLRKFSRVRIFALIILISLVFELIWPSHKETIWFNYLLVLTPFCVPQAILTLNILTVRKLTSVYVLKRELIINLNQTWSILISGLILIIVTMNNWLYLGVGIISACGYQTLLVLYSIISEKLTIPHYSRKKLRIQPTQISRLLKIYFIFIYRVIWQNSIQSHTKISTGQNILSKLLLIPLGFEVYENSNCIE